MSAAALPESVLQALIEEAWERARRRRRRYLAILAFTFVGAFLGVANGLPFSRLGISGASAGKPVVIATSWNETQSFANNHGVVRLHVRKLEFTGTSWKAWVGLTNVSRVPVTLLPRERLYHDVSLPLTYVAAPGVWWQTYHREGGHWLPGAGWTENHVARSASIRPRYPDKLAPKKSWFGVFTGSSAKVPEDRLLSIGFGVACICPENWQHRTPLSTNHTFKLPR